MYRRPPRSTLLPYTTLFGSREARALAARERLDVLLPRRLFEADAVQRRLEPVPPRVAAGQAEVVLGGLVLPERALRSEEHTSELQSRQYLVCRLLLENKDI